MFSIFAEGTTLTTPDFAGTVTTSKEALQTSFADAWHRIVSFTPNLLAAIVVLVVGYFVSKFVARAVTMLCTLQVHTVLLSCRRAHPKIWSTACVQVRTSTGTPRTCSHRRGPGNVWSSMCFRRLLINDDR